MAEPTKDFEKLRKEQEEEEDDTDLLAELDKEGKEFDKVRSEHFHRTSYDTDQ